MNTKFFTKGAAETKNFASHALRGAKRLAQRSYIHQNLSPRLEPNRLVAMKQQYHRHDEGESEKLIASSSSSSSHGKSSSMVKKVSIGASLGALALFATSTSSSSMRTMYSSPLGESAAGATAAVVNTSGGANANRNNNNQKKIFTLHTSCSPLLQDTKSNVLSFPMQDNWKYIGAKLITKSMSEEFDFDSAKEMQMTSCGTFEVEHDEMKLNEQFGFFLYPKPRPTVADEDADGEEERGSSMLGSGGWARSFVGRLGRDEKDGEEESTAAITKNIPANTGKYRAVSELACENVSPHEEDHCPASRKGKIGGFSLNALGDDESAASKEVTNAFLSKCTGQFTHGVSEKTGGVKNVLYNRVFDGKTLSYVWGSCAHTCENADQPHRTPVSVGCDVPKLFAVKAKMSISGNGMNSQKLLSNEKQNGALKSAIASIVNVRPNDVVIKSLKDVAMTEEALLGEMKQSQDEGFMDISQFAQRVAKLENQHSEVYKENQQLTQLNIELAENKKALEDKINNWKAENEKLRKAIAERQTTLENANTGSQLGEEVVTHGKSVTSATTAAPAKSPSPVGTIEVEFEIVVQENQEDPNTIVKSLLNTAPEQMLKVLNNSRGINMLKQVTYLSAPKVREVLETESTLSLEAIPQVPKTEEQLAKEKKRIDNANDAVKAATSASKVAEIEAERKVSEEVETARELVEQEKIAASNAFREAFRAKESAMSEKDEEKKGALEKEAAELEAKAVKAQEEADLAQEVLNEETKKFHHSGDVDISSSSSSSLSPSSSAIEAEAKAGHSDVDDDDGDKDKEFKEILEEVEEARVEEQKEALEEKRKNADTIKVTSCHGKIPTHKVQASVAISGAGITSASQISTHPEFADSFSKTIVALTSAEEDQLIWLDLSTRPREEEEDSRSSKLGAWFSSVALGRFVSDDSNEEPVEVTFSLLACSRKGAEDFADKLYGVTPKSMLASATEYGAAIDDIQFVSPPKVLTVDKDFLETYNGPTIEGKSTSVNVKPRVKTALKVVSSEKEAEMEEKGERIEEEEEREEEKEEELSRRSSDESGNGSLSEELASIQRDSLLSIQRHRKEKMTTEDDDEEAF